jgi:hypothetical protein
MPYAKAQHELVGVIVDRYPELVRSLAEIARVRLPGYDQVVSASNRHQVRDGHPIETDTTVRLLSGGEPRHFVQVEMQQEYSFGKLCTLRAYHGSEIRNVGCGGHVFVLSPRAGETAKFRKGDAASSSALAYQAAYLSGRDLAPLSRPGAAFAERALAAAMSDLRTSGVPPGAVRMLMEMRNESELIADLFMRAMLEECADVDKLGEDVDDAVIDRLSTVPAFRDWVDRKAVDIRAASKAEGVHEHALHALLTYFAVKRDTPTSDAIATMRACTDPAILDSWLQRAYQGETSTEIFGTPSAE